MKLRRLMLVSGDLPVGPACVRACVRDCVRAGSFVVNRRRPGSRKSSVASLESFRQSFRRRSRRRRQSLVVVQWPSSFSRGAAAAGALLLREVGAARGLEDVV